MAIELGHERELENIVVWLVGKLQIVCCKNRARFNHGKGCPVFRKAANGHWVISRYEIAGFIQDHIRDNFARSATTGSKEWSRQAQGKRFVLLVAGIILDDGYGHQLSIEWINALPVSQMREFLSFFGFAALFVRQSAHRRVWLILCLHAPSGEQQDPRNGGKHLPNPVKTKCCVHSLL